MVELVIRPAEQQDLPACARIVIDEVTSVPWLPNPPTEDVIVEAFETGFANQRLMRVAELDGAVVGYTSIEPREDQPHHMHALYLQPQVRGNGIGASLLGEAKALCGEGFELTVFEPNVGAQRFYEREGLQEIPERRDDETEEGVPTLLYVWKSR